MTIRWFVLSEDPSVPDSIRTALSPQRLPMVRHAQLGELLEALKEEERAAVFLYPGQAYNLYEVCQELSFSFTQLPIILLGSKEELDLKKAMRMGAADTVALPIQKVELKQAIQGAERRLKPKGTHGMEGRVITVCGTKGGVGKTTLSVNLAFTFSKYDLKVALLDADLQFGDVAIMADTRPKRTIYELVTEANGEWLEVMDRYMTHHPSGVHILPAPVRPEFSEFITGEHMREIIQSLKALYDIVIIDTPPSLLETGLVALECSSDILLVASMELPALKNSRLCMETLETLGLKERTKVILNRDSEVEGLRMQSVEQVLGTEVFARIPSEGKVVVPSVNMGIPFVLAQTRSAVSRSVFALASQLQGARGSAARDGRKTRSLLARVLGRR